MSLLARTVQHKYTGESITFLQSAAETAGQYLLIEVALPAQGEGPPLHCHDRFVEQFVVMQGKLTVNINRVEQVVEVGQTLTAPMGTAHTFRNGHDEPVVFQVKLTPPQQFEESVRIHYGLMDDGLTDKNGVPNNIFHTALMLVLQNTLVADKPLWLQRGLFGVLIRIGQLTNAYKPLEKYTGKKITLK